jgi:hypothetical protein
MPKCSCGSFIRMGALNAVTITDLSGKPKSVICAKCVARKSIRYHRNYKKGDIFTVWAMVVGGREYPGKPLRDTLRGNIDEYAND